jgi:phosphocarrier protein HPr
VIKTAEKQALVKKLKIKNRSGLHTRPATSIVKILQPFQANVTFTYKKIQANAKSILGLLALAATKGATITVTCAGEDADLAMQALVEGFESKFGEEEHA